MDGEGVREADILCDVPRRAGERLTLHNLGREETTRAADEEERGRIKVWPSGIFTNGTIQ